MNQELNSKKAWNKLFKQNPRNQKLTKFLKRELDYFLSYLTKDSKILDFGCGVGDKTEYIRKKGFEVIGIDLSTQAIKFGKRTFPKCKLKEVKSLNTKFKSKSFDAIVAIAFLHCLNNKQIKKVIKEINKIIKDKGKIYILVMSDKDSTTKERGKKVEKDTYLMKSNKIFHLFSKEELKDLFSNYRFLTIKEKSEVKGKRNAVITAILEKNLK